MSADLITASVIVPAYNAGTFIRKALESAWSQTRKPLEIIVGNDASTDDTSAVARSMGAIVLDLPKGNGAIARNEAVKAAKGDLLFFLDADDWWEPNKIEVHFQKWREHMDSAVILDRSVAIFPDGTEPGWRGGLDRDGDLTYQDLLSHRAWPSGSGFSVPRDKYWAVGGFNENLLKYQDVDFWIRITSHFGKSYQMRDELTHYLLVPGSVSKKVINLQANLSNLFESWEGYVTEKDKARFTELAHLMAAEQIPFPRSIKHLLAAKSYLSDRYYYKCLLSSLKKTFQKNDR